MHGQEGADNDRGGVDQAPHNVRVVLSDAEEESEEEMEDEGEEEDAPMDRAHLKDQAMSTVERAQRKGKPRRAKGGGHKKKEG